MLLRTDRLLLREFREEDWRAVLAYQDDPRFLRFYPWTQRAETDARAFVQRFLDWQAEQPRNRFQLAITLDGDVIGNAGIRRSAAEPRVADTGFELAPAHWGRGYATEAVRAVVGFGFSALGLHRVTAHCIAENTASANVLTRLGMQREGHLREHEFFRDRWWDVLLFGILRSEWQP